MKNINHSPKPNKANNDTSHPNPWTRQSLATVRTTARDYPNPIDYQHPYPSMARFADHLALRYDANRTRHSYYRQLRLIHQHVGCDPAAEIAQPQQRLRLRVAYFSHPLQGQEALIRQYSLKFRPQLFRARESLA